MDEQKTNNSIAQDIGKSFAALEQYIAANIMLDVNTSLEKLDNKLERILALKDSDTSKYEQSIQQFKLDISAIKDEATKRLEDSDLRMMEFVEGFKELSKVLIAKG